MLTEHCAIACLQPAISSPVSSSFVFFFKIFLAALQLVSPHVFGTSCELCYKTQYDLKKPHTIAYVYHNDPFVLYNGIPFFHFRTLFLGVQLLSYWMQQTFRHSSIPFFSYSRNVRKMCVDQV
jgi:hypothetical protein